MLLVVLLSLVGYNKGRGGDGEILHKNPHVCGLFCHERAAPTGLNLLCLRTWLVLGLSPLLQEVELGAVPLPGCFTGRGVTH